MLIILDLDNTITDYKKPISEDMATLLKSLKHRIWIITSSTSTCARHQLGDLFNVFERVYCSAGAELFVNGRLVEFHEALPDKPVLDYLINNFQNLDVRTASINISLTSNTANSEVKRIFAESPANTKLRYELADAIEQTFPNIHATVTGRTSILIHQAGKEQIMDAIEDPSNTIFLGDEVDAGIDASLATALRAAGGKAINVANPSETYEILDEINFNRL